MANLLIHETSPYLLQHAHNPVQWYPWGSEAFEKAKQENKPVLVSIGYAACHWCHVMEKESFENEEVAQIMNRHFVNIKVDREERPDVDQIYMDAVQAITGSGGWPLNVFLTPDKKPFYGGTYFPPRRAFNRAPWREVLLAIADAYQNRKEEILEQANSLTLHLETSNAFGIATAGKTFATADIDTAFQNLMKLADKEWGGFGNAPKFPQTFSLNFLLQYELKNGGDSSSPLYLERQPNKIQAVSEAEGGEVALHSLNKMMQGGIYDHIGGGFARYSTDREWLVPHFEKMLYDNALLVAALSDAYLLTKDESYKETIEQTLAFVERELMHDSGGFFSALDADSEGEEGKFYVWTYEEVQHILGNETQVFCDYYDITPGGNWSEGNKAEAKNILRVKIPLKEFAAKYQLNENDLKLLLADGRQKLLEHRSKRVRPQLDDKVLLNWNALMNIGYSKAFAATGNEKYREKAVANMDFMLHVFGEPARLFHSWKNGTAKHPAFLDDYANLIAALTELAQITSDFTYLIRASELTEAALENFSDSDNLFFYYTHKAQLDIPVRKKELYDGATPSGNAMMAQNLYRLSIFFNNSGWRERAEKMIGAVGELAVKYPTSFGVWLCFLFEMVSGTSEVAITGPDAQKILKEIQSLFIPHSIIMASENADENWPLLAGKEFKGENHIYLCKNYSCQKPVSTVADFVKLLNLK